MIRRFNRTGRKAIARQHAKVTLHKPGPDQTYFEISLYLESYGFPEDARVRVEASRSNAVQRWEFGTVGDVRSPPRSDRVLRDVPESAEFRVAIVAPDDSGLLFGLSDSIRPRRQPTTQGAEAAAPQGAETAAESLLHVEIVNDLQQEVWRLDFGDEELPVLQLNDSIVGVAHIVEHDPTFRSLVIPEILRSILQRAVLVARIDPDDPEPNAWTDWLVFAKRQTPDTDVPALTDLSDSGERDAALSWIEDVVSRFAAQRGFDAATTYSKAMEARS